MLPAVVPVASTRSARSGRIVPAATPAKVTVWPDSSPENAVHIPAACIIGDTANHGGPACTTLA